MSHGNEWYRRVARRKLAIDRFVKDCLRAINHTLPNISIIRSSQRLFPLQVEYWKENFILEFNASSSWPNASIMRDKTSLKIAFRETSKLRSGLSRSIYQMPFFNVREERGAKKMKRDVSYEGKGSNVPSRRHKVESVLSIDLYRELSKAPSRGAKN